MPEKVIPKFHVEVEIDNVSESSEIVEEEASEYDQNEYLERNEYPLNNEDLDNSDEELKDIGELLGFRITGGKDFFMPITIFHVSNIPIAAESTLSFEIRIRKYFILMTI